MSRFPSAVRAASVVGATVAAATVVTALAAAARAEDPDPVAFVAAARAKHADQIAAGMKSFAAKVHLRHSDDASVMLAKDSAEFVYRFTAPATEDFDFVTTAAAFRKPLRDTLTGLWREVTGTLGFPLLDGVKELKLARGVAADVVTGTAAAGGEVSASFDPLSGALASVTTADSVTRTWTCTPSPKGLEVARMDVGVLSKPVYTASYTTYRKVKAFRLPTVVRLVVDGKVTEFALEYVQIDDSTAFAEPLEAAVVKARIDEFEKGWKVWDATAKVAKLRDLADCEGELVSAVIAKLGLKDASGSVREAAAEVLGTMKLANVVPALLTAMPANEKDLRVYLAVIGALGEIGDPRAVDVLSKDWWNQKAGEHAIAAANAKIAALGKIRHVSAVDALLDTFTMTTEDRLGWVRPTIVASLKALTRQDFLFDRKAWNDWWKKNRSSHKF